MIESNYKDHIYALIVAGGGGTRLWPKSLENSPKQFLSLFNKETLTQITSRRLSKIVPWERICVVTVSGAYKSEIMREVPEILPDNIIVEPARKDTGPAHCVGAAFIYNKDPNAVIVTESADRLVKPVDRYLHILQMAAKVAFEERVLIAFGVEARYPHIGLGHIKRGVKKNFVRDVNFFKLDKFIEKPSLPLAKKYTSSGNYYWNAGQYVWRADLLLETVKKFEPKVYECIEKIRNSFGKPEEREVFGDEYGKLPETTSNDKPLSIDYLVSERANNMYVVEGDIFWTDIGDWKEVWENSQKDELGNVILDSDEPGGAVYNIDTTDSLIHTDRKLIAVIDVDNIVIIDTKDALLVCSKGKAQDVKKIVNILKEENKVDLL